jgi:nucleoside-diphosphate-sugar epimerase/uncharacterized membrane protein
MPSSNEIIIVTGSSGLIGSALVKRLAQQYAVIGFDREGPPHPPPGIESIDMDMTSDMSVQRGLAQVQRRYGKRLASVIHLAAYFDFSGEPSPLYEQVTVRGTERLLRGLRNFELEQFLFSSTMLVHAPCEPGQRINEDWPLDPKWDYPKSKMETETLILRERNGIPVLMLRIAGVYDDRCHSIPLANQIQRIYERQMTGRVFPGSTSHGQSFVHLEDLLDAIVLAVDRRSRLPPELTLLIGEPEALSYDELQHTFARLIHQEQWETREIPKAAAKAGAWVLDNVPLAEDPFIKPWMIDLADDHYALDITRAWNLLGWSPRRSLRETLPKIITALKKDPRTWYRENKLNFPEEDSGAEQKNQMTASEIPLGWDYNPSTWDQRLPIIAVALAGFGIALYLALFQWRILDDVWEPFFGQGSRVILDSPISHILPIPDAALGAFGYLLDAVTGAIGDRRRWRTMPWMVILFGLAVGPLGAVSLLLVIVQPVLLDNWCTLCLVSALLAVVMIGPAMDEVLASLQYLKRQYEKGHSIWHAFWGRQDLRSGQSKAAPRSEPA